MAVLLVVILGLLPRLILGWSSVMTLVRVSMPDDAFYYFKIAQNVVAGNGVTFDGLAPTNGFHPLWLGALLPVFEVTSGSPELSVHVAVTLGIALDLAGALIVFALAARLGRDRMAGIVALAIYWLNPYSAMAATNGVETALAVVLIAAAVFWYLQLVDGEPDGRSGWAVLGLLWGLMMLSRTDTVFVAGAMAIDAVLRLPVRRRAVAGVAIAAVMALVVASPWFLWSLSTFGTPVQVSGLAWPTLLHTLRSGEWGGYWSRGFLLHEVGMAKVLAASLARLSGLRLVLPLWGIALLIALMRKPGRASLGLVRTPLSRLVFLLVGVAIPLMINVLWRWLAQPWYFPPTIMAGSLVCGLVMAGLLPRRKKLVAVLAMATTLSFVVESVHLYRRGWYPNQEATLRRVMPAVTRECQHVDRIGVADAGYIGYFAPCRVVNLDGVVNNRAYEALTNGTLLSYLDSVGVDRVILNRTIRQVIGPTPRLVPTGDGVFLKVLPDNAGARGPEA